MMIYLYNAIRFTYDLRFIDPDGDSDAELEDDKLLEVTLLIEEDF